MVAQAVFNFKFERTEKPITSHGGIPFFVRYISGLGLTGLANTYLAISGQVCLKTDYLLYFPVAFHQTWSNTCDFLV